MYLFVFQSWKTIVIVCITTILRFSFAFQILFLNIFYSANGATSRYYIKVTVLTRVSGPRKNMSLFFRPRIEPGVQSTDPQ